MMVIGLFLTMLMSCTDEIPVYTVRFDSQGGSAVSAKEAFKGTRITEPAAPTRANHEFGGWYKDAGLSSAWDFDKDTVTSDLTLYAKWTAHTYPITYQGNGNDTGTVPQPQEKTHGTNLILSANTGDLQRTGYSFAGWNTQSDGSGTDYAEGSTYTSDTALTLYAKWSVNSYTVSFDSQGGSNPSPANKSVTKGTMYGTLPTVTRSGYTFDGWWTEQGGAGIQIFPITTASIDSNQVLFAKWVNNKYSVTLDNQNGNGGTTSVQAVFDLPMPHAIAPTRSDYGFDGYYDQTNGGGNKYYSLTMESVRNWDKAEHAILYANWVDSHYTVSFDSQGGSSVSSIENVLHGRKIPEPVSPIKDLHVFGGWYRDSSCTQRYYFTTDVVTSNVTLYAKWFPPYTVSFDSQGGSPVAPIENILHDTMISEPVSPTRPLHVFGGWYRDSSCTQRYYFTTDVVTSNVTLYAKWFPPYTVSFDSRGGSPVAQITEATHGDVIPEPAAPIKSSYAFDGWYRESNLTNRWNFNTDTVDSDMTLYAKWIELHLVSFDSREGSGVNAIEIGNGRTLTEPAVPTRIGYTFDGWYKEIACINRWYFNTDTVTTTRTLYAKWTARDYTITFNSQGETTPNPANKIVTYEQAYGELPTVTRNGYTFGGWWTGAGGTGAQIQSTTIVDITSNQILYAKWLPQYTVTFNSQEGSNPSPSSKIVTYDQAYGELPTVTRNGYTFAGWWTEAGGTGTQVLATSVVAIQNNHILYAKWSGNSFMVSFDSQGGTQPEPKSVTNDQPYGELPTVTKEGYTFGGWWTGTGGTGIRVHASTTVSITSDQILYAAWHLPYTVTFDSRQGTQPEPTSKIVTYDQAYGELPSVTRSGYTFGGWWTGTNGTGKEIQAATVVTITSNQTLYAKWNVNSYTVNFDSRGGSNPNPANKSVTYDQAYGELPSVTRSGYTFGGWWTGTNGTGKEIQAATVVTITSNQTLYAKWNVNSYTVNFDSRGGSNPNPANKSVTYDQAYGELPSVTRSGYTFGGWWTGTNGTGKEIQAATVVTITSNQTLYAKWNVNSYTVNFDSRGGSNPNPANKSVTYDQAYGELPSVTRSGYTFGGWWTGTGGTGTQIQSWTTVSITSNQTLYAKWNIIPYGGPSGGYVFYENPNYETDGWRYLEAAPAGWSGGSADPRFVFGYHRTSANESNMTVGTIEGIGSGKENTRKLVGAMGLSAYSSSSGSEKTTQYAARMCADYRGGGYDDWFLPSLYELNLMYRNLYSNNLGGFSPDSYLSSSENDANNACSQYFYYGVQINLNRNIEYRVRPVRAF